jgi:uncharacterized protein (TIGR03083 family)
MPDPDDAPLTKTDCQQRIQAGWSAFRDAVAQLTPDQLEGPRSADGWTVKDHLAHVSAWEASAVALLRGDSRAAAMDVDEATFNAGFEAVNAAVQIHYSHRPVDEVTTRLDDVHHELLVTLDALTDTDLQRPYQSYQPTATGEHVQVPVLNWVVGNTYEHYAEHLPWIEAILAGEAS